MVSAIINISHLTSTDQQKNKFTADTFIGDNLRPEQLNQQNQEYRGIYATKNQFVNYQFIGDN